MDVATAADRRKSVRSFLDTPVTDERIAALLETAARAPSGGNVQPWRVFVLNGDSMARFREFMTTRDMEPAAYEIYPSGLTEPYRSSRFRIGEMLYESIGIPREDKEARFGQMLKNYDFFGAPAAFFCFIDRQMGPPQWSDLGMFLQTFMLAATADGLATCPQEAWAVWEGAITEFVGAPDELRLFCGMAIGVEDTDHPINSFRSEREPLDVFATWV